MSVTLYFHFLLSFFRFGPDSYPLIDKTITFVFTHVKACLMLKLVRLAVNLAIKRKTEENYKAATTFLLHCIVEISDEVVKLRNYLQLSKIASCSGAGSGCSSCSGGPRDLATITLCMDE